MLSSCVLCPCAVGLPAVPTVVWTCSEMLTCVGLKERLEETLSALVYVFTSQRLGFESLHIAPFLLQLVFEHPWRGINGS